VGQVSKTINISVKEKIATITAGLPYVCGNSDYIVVFDFDAEWDAYPEKTARFRYGKNYKDVIFNGTECPMPIIENTLIVEVGVYAGNLLTTNPAYVTTVKSILCGEGSPAAPANDVYNQIMERLNRLDGVNPATVDTLGVIKVGNNLEITKDGVLSVTTTAAAEQDNTKPITSAAVYTTIGNINALLETI
jgi:hypothetical protein